MGSARSCHSISEVTNLLDLLLEIQEEIFSSWCGKDLKNFACCSSESNKVVKSILWKNVKIPWVALARTTDIREDGKIKNLIHTRGIRFEGELPINDNRVKELLRPNFLNIMDHLNQQAIETFSIINLPNASYIISLACKKLKYSRTVILIGTKSISLRVVQLLSCFIRLRDLNLSNSNIDDEKLISLCQNLTTVTLKRLSIEKCINLDTSFHVLSSLISLESLNVAYTNMDNNALEKLTHLEFLSGLNISGCTKISYLGFQYIDKIRSLTYLKMNNIRINGAALEDYERLRKLEQTDGSAEEYLLLGETEFPSDLSLPVSDPIDIF